MKQPDVQGTNDLTPRIADRLVGRDVPVVDDKGRSRPDTTLFEDLVVDRCAQPSAYGTRSVFCRDVRRNSQIPLKNRDGANFLSFVHFTRKHLVLNRIHDIVPAVHQIAGVQHTQ